MHNPTTDPDDRLKAFGNQLVNVHLWLRDELADLRENVEAYLSGDGPRPRELRAHCLTFCSAITRHHVGEDETAFRALAEEFPELHPVLEELRHDHETVADLLRQLQDLLDDLDPSDGQRARRELDGLSALLESHFTYEERRIVGALNALPAPEWRTSRPDFLLTANDG
ncbi:hemerythrin domain-containing protein [Nonomuraea sp. NN258]|nr:hemerythrin domain-containing protein [Nonomuraea antri]